MQFPIRCGAGHISALCSPLSGRCAQAAAAFTPFAIATAAAALLWHRRAGAGPRRRWEVALSVLMSATPCPLVIGVPVCYLCAASKCAERATHLRTAHALEVLARCRDFEIIPPPPFPPIFFVRFHQRRCYDSAGSRGRVPRPSAVSTIGCRVLLGDFAAVLSPNPVQMGGFFVVSELGL